MNPLLQWEQRFSPKDNRPELRGFLPADPDLTLFVIILGDELDEGELMGALIPDEAEDAESEPTMVENAKARAELWLERWLLEICRPLLTQIGKEAV